MNKSIISPFQKMIDVNTPIIYINDYDFARVDEIISEVVGKKDIVEWNPATGCTDFFNKASKADQSIADFLHSRYILELPSFAPNPENSFIPKALLFLCRIRNSVDSFHICESLPVG